MIPEWDSLPVDIWDSIFQRVDEDDFNGISRTCKLFLSITDRLRTTLTISNQTVAVRILRRCRNIKRLNVHCSMRGDLDCLICDISTSGVAIEALSLFYKQEFFPSWSIREAGEGTLGRTLKILICKGWPLEDQYLFAISEGFPALEELDISYMGNYVTDAGIEVLASKLAHLRKINVSGCHHITDASLSFLSSNCTSLSEVHLLDCSGLSGEAMTSFIAQKPKLISFSFCIDFGFGFPSFAGGKALQCLKISRSFLSDDRLLSIAKSRLPLRELCIPRCSVFSLSGLDLLLQAF
ncbi:hypothetical protein QJS10_CPA02g01218 [Acorus calamus]|uniref:F-box domain-containing protein n=1 Tax=Acorus calamus TaxID=4465 RepID=A0AAV9FEP4_ACOCL|nr:hypothetical protein QJS10_CPA02g01218 [Acorus calamus]